MTIRKKTKKTFAVGVDLGTSAEGTAIAVVELVRSPSSPTDPPPDQPGLHLRHLERFPPGTSYGDIAKGLLDLLDSEELSHPKEKTASGTRDVDVTVYLVIDQTVVGSPMVDMILRKVNRPGRRVFISGSHTQRYSDGLHFVPKPELISLLLARLETGQLEFAEALPLIKELVDALINYQDRKTDAMPPVDPWREHKSDDLVFALALACWRLQEIGFISCESL